MNFINPFEEGNDISISPCVLVIFGATGDLTARRLIPALYNLAKEGRLPSHFACVGFARRQKSHDLFRKEMFHALQEFSRTQPLDTTTWDKFSERLFYHIAHFDDDEGYSSLKTFLDDIDIRFGTQRNRVYYLSTAPSFFPYIAQKLSQTNLITETTRLIIEKPFGHDLNSAQELQKELLKYCKESQIYRIDHWLGKETVQNLFVLRFGNGIFESLWNKEHIDHIQISVSEDIGVGSRGKFFEEVGWLRDMVQNHTMQLLSLVAMEKPKDLSPDAIRDEKVKVLKALRPIPIDQVPEYVVRGQYGPANSMKGYRNEDNVYSESFVDTYVAAEIYVDNDRWHNVPFYIRGGKRLAKRATEIAIVFKGQHNPLYPTVHPNVLAIKIQPDEGISLKINSKIPGLTLPILPVKMDFKYTEYFGASSPEAYERLLCDAISSDATLFAREDEVLNSWKFISPIQEYFQKNPPKNFPNYEAGSMGPKEAELLLERSGKRWRIL